MEGFFRLVRSNEPVWPDIGLKNSPIFPKFAKSTVFTKTRDIF